MTKIVQAISIEHAIRKALQRLGEAGASQALEAYSGQRKSVSLLRKCADPDNPRYNIQLRDAIALDRACIDANYPPPLRQAYDAALDDRQNNSLEPDADLYSLMLAINVAAGGVGDVILKMQANHNCRVCENQLRIQPVFDRLTELEATVSDLRRTLTAQARLTDTPNSKEQHATLPHQEL